MTLTVTERDRRELLITVIADLLDGIRHVAVGESSPIPAAGAMLLRARNVLAGKPPVLISVLGSLQHNFFTNGAYELFDAAAQGRIDAFFLGGGQIDGRGNINLVGTGTYPKLDIRWPGSFGSAYMYHLVPRVILFREEHSPRVLVDKVDFISASGVSDGIERRGGPCALLTGMALFDFGEEQRRFVLRSVHPGYTVDDVKAQTGFFFDVNPDICETPTPDDEIVALLRGQILRELGETYPDFASAMTQAQYAD